MGYVPNAIIINKTCSACLDVIGNNQYVGKVNAFDDIAHSMYFLVSRARTFQMLVIKFITDFKGQIQKFSKSTFWETDFFIQPSMFEFQF